MKFKVRDGERGRKSTSAQEKSESSLGLSDLVLVKCGALIQQKRRELAESGDVSQLKALEALSNVLCEVEEVKTAENLQSFVESLSSSIQQGVAYVPRELITEWDHAVRTHLVKKFQKNEQALLIYKVHLLVKKQVELLELGKELNAAIKEVQRPYSLKATAKESNSTLEESNSTLKELNDSFNKLIGHIAQLGMYLKLLDAVKLLQEDGSLSSIFAGELLVLQKYADSKEESLPFGESRFGVEGLRLMELDKDSLFNRFCKLPEVQEGLQSASSNQARLG